MRELLILLVVVLSVLYVGSYLLIHGLMYRFERTKFLKANQDAFTVVISIVCIFWLTFFII
jgi:hypothetical protein